MTRDPIDGTRLSPWFEGRDAELAEAVLRSARGPQRRRRWQRKGLRGLSLVLVFAVGHLSAHPEWLQEAIGSFVATQESAPTINAESNPAEIDLEDGEPPTANPLDLDPAALAALSPLDFEIFARSADGASRSLLLRQAGDRYLAETNDTTAALRCYRLHLNAEGQVLANADDSWLLSTMKTAL